MEPAFLTLDEVLLIHDNQLRLYGGESGIRDIGLLQSAISVPKSTFDGAFLHRNCVEMAAAYLFHIVSNHPFVDGNKRTGTVAALVFLLINDISFTADDRQLEEAVVSVASGKWTKRQLTRFFLNNTVAPV